MYKVWCQTKDEANKISVFLNTVLNLEPPFGVYVTDDYKYSGFDRKEAFIDHNGIMTTADEFIKTNSKYDPVNHPSHYACSKVECIDAMEQTFGKDAVISFAILNAWKYLWRRKDKDNEEQDIQKALWYFDKAKELINK